MRTEQLQEGVLCQLKIGSWGARTKLSEDQLGDDIPSEIIRGIQDLVEDKTLIKDIRAIKRQARTLLKNNSMAFPVDNVFWIPRHKIEDLDNQFNELKEQYRENAETLARNITKIKINFKRKYPKFYSPEKYPSRDQIRAKYYFHWRFFQFQLPDKKAGILSANVYRREREKFQQIANEMNEMAINIIGNQLLARIEKLQEQCDTDTINAGTVKRLEKFMEKWNDLWAGNVDHTKMESIMKSLRLQMARTSADRLKNNEDFRSRASKKMESIAKQIKAMPDFKLKRKLDV